LIWLTFWLMRLIFRLCQPHASSWLQSFLNWSRLHPAFTDTAKALADPKHPEAKGLAIMATILIFAVALLALMLGAILGGTTPAGIDLTVLNSLKSLHAPWTDNLMLFSSRLADHTVIMTIIIAVAIFLVWQKHWRTLWYWLAAAGFALLASFALKYGLQVERPPNQVQGLGPYSFPSGHTLRATVIYGFLALIIARSVQINWRWLPYSLAGIVVLMVAMARLYLGVHWLSDIIGSITLGIFWVTILGIVYYRHTDAETHWLGLGIGSILVIAIVTGLQSGRMHSSDLANYFPKPEVREITAADWSAQGWMQLPATRKDVREKHNHPMSIQYAGELERVTTNLKQNGWSEAPTLSWGSALKFLSPDLPIQELPLPPQVHDGHHETLALIKAMPDDRRLVLRLWPAFVRVQPGAKSLWIGNVTEQFKQEVAGIFSFPYTSDLFDQAYKIMLEDSSSIPHKRYEGERAVVLWRSSN
jgi:undecaprenyl-diphosphatase